MKNMIQSFVVIMTTLIFVGCSGGGSSGNTFIPAGTPATSETFNSPTGLAVSGSTVYIAEGLNSFHGIHKVVSGYITDFAGTGSTGSADGTGTSASFNIPFGLATDASGNVFVADYLNNKIRKITPAGVVTTFAGTGVGGFTNGAGATAQFFNPSALTFDNAGNLFVADAGNNMIRKITPAGVVSLYAGTGGIGALNGAALSATFDNPCGLAFDSAGNLFVSDASNFIIRKIAPNGGMVTTFAGTAGASGTTNATGATARFASPFGMVADSSNNIYVADYGNHSIRKITPGAVVTTYVGLSGSSGNTNGTGPAARFSNPTFLAIDASNNIYVSEEGNNLVRHVTPGLVVTTFAGH